MELFENLPAYEPKKNRDIKVSTNDLYLLFENIYNLAAEHMDDIPEDDYQTISILFNKYIVLSKLRDEETFWYDVVKKLDASAPNILNQEEYQNQRRSSFDFYIKAKNDREKLKKEIGNG